jgi:large subunit ribosomal protein L7/L12
MTLDWQSLVLGLVIGLFVGLAMGRSRSSTPAAPPAPARPLSPDQIAHVRALAASGQKIEAIKAYREATGVGLKQSKEFVDSL